MIENAPSPSLKQSIDRFCSSHFPIIIFFFLFYLQTLIFLAENRKSYQIGITVLLAVVFFPKDGMDLSLVRKPSAVYAQTYSEPEKENEGGGKPWVTHFKTKSCGLQTPGLRQRLAAGRCSPTGNRVMRHSALYLVTLQDFAPGKEREEDAKSGPVSPGQFSMEMAAGFVVRCPPRHCSSPLLVIFNSSLFPSCWTWPVLAQDHHGKML